MCGGRSGSNERNGVARLPTGTGIDCPFWLNPADSRSSDVLVTSGLSDIFPGPLKHFDRIDGEQQAYLYC